MAKKEIDNIVEELTDQISKGDISLIKLLKGRRRSFISLISAGLFIAISNEVIAGLIAGLVIETITGLAEYLIKNNNEDNWLIRLLK